MANWVQVTNDISNAVLSKFHKFFVTDTGNSNSTNDPSHAAHISYLANVFKVDPAKLIHQTEQHKLTAVSEKRKDPTLTTINRCLAQGPATDTVNAKSTSDIPCGCAASNVAVPWSGDRLRQWRRA